MNKFFYYNSLCSGANTQSVFSIDPYVAAIKELLVSELKQVVFYIEKLRGMDFDMLSYTDKVIEFITILIVNLDFKKENTFIIIEDLYSNKKMLEKMYISACEKSDVSPDLFPFSDEDLSSEDIILKALASSPAKITTKRKILYEIMMNIVLNSCNKLMELKNYGISLTKAKNQVLSFLNTTNIPSLSEDDLTRTIKNFAKNNYEITTCLYKTLIKKYGPVVKSEVDICTKEGKAILVSGNCFGELEKILDEVKGLNINVYSYNEMISAFQYKEFREHPNFVGHYYSRENNIQTDFAQFPGPIFVSKNSMPKIDVIRGRIYTSAKYPAFGISRIENNDFSPLIQNALDSKGFDKDYTFKSLKIGYDKEETQNRIKDIISKFNDNIIKNIVIINSNINSEYINEFLDLKSEHDYIILCGQEKEGNNILNINSYFDFSVLYEIIEDLTKGNQKIKENISVFLTECSSTTVSHIFNFIYLDVKNIFLGECCPNVISPMLINGLKEMFKIEEMTTPKKDWQIISSV